MCFSDIVVFEAESHTRSSTTSSDFHVLQVAVAKLSNLKLNLAMLLLIQTVDSNRGWSSLFFIQWNFNIQKITKNDGISLLIEKQFTSTTSNDSDVYLWYGKSTTSGSFMTACSSNSFSWICWTFSSSHSTSEAPISEVWAGSCASGCFTWRQSWRLARILGSCVGIRSQIGLCVSGILQKVEQRCSKSCSFLSMSLRLLCWYRWMEFSTEFAKERSKWRWQLSICCHCMISSWTLKNLLWPTIRQRDLLQESLWK